MVTFNNQREIGPKETVYDNEITPLLKKVKTICDQHNISMLTHFVLDRNETGCIYGTGRRIRPQDEPPLDMILVALLADEGLKALILELLNNRILVPTPTGFAIIPPGNCAVESTMLKEGSEFDDPKGPEYASGEQAEPGNN